MADLLASLQEDAQNTRDLLFAERRKVAALQDALIEALAIIANQPSTWVGSIECDVAQPNPRNLRLLEIRDALGADEMVLR